MNFKLGIKDDLIADCTDVKQVLDRVRGLDKAKNNKASDLTEFEIKELTMKSTEGADGQPLPEYDEPEELL